jgi:hypothetical protein
MRTWFGLPCPCTQRASSANEPPEHHNIIIVPTSMRHNSTTMYLTEKAIEEIESREEGASFGYREVAKRWGCNRTTLSRRH